MKKFKKSLQNLSFQNRLVFSYSLVLAVIMIVGIFLYQMSFRQVKNGIDTRNTAIMSASIDKLDDTMTTISMTAQQLSSNSAFATLSGYGFPRQETSSGDFYYNAYHAQQDLKSVFPLKQLIPASDTFLYMKNSGYIISPSEFVPFASYAKYRLLCTPEMALDFEESLNMKSNRNRFISLSEFDSRRDGYLYLYPIAIGNTFAEKYIQAYLCCIFDQDLMEDYFPGLLEGSASIIARDSSGNEKLRLSLEKDRDYRQKLLSFSLPSSYNGWEYTYQQPESQAYYSINRYRNLFISIAGLAVLLECLVVYYFSIINSRPVKQLSKELVVKEQLAFSLSEMVEKNRPLVTESYIRRIMEGSITTDDEMAYITKDLHLDRPDIKYQVLYMEVYPSEDFNVQMDDMALCLQNYDVLVRDALKRHFPDTGYLYKPSDRFFSVLLASSESLSHDQVMLHNIEKFSALHTELLSQYGIWSRGGFGGRNGRLSNTWKSFQQARDAKSITTTEHYVQNYDNFINTSDTYYYPEIISMQLTSSIASGNKDQTAEIFHLITRENTVSRTLPRSQRQQLISDIRGTLFKKRCSIPAISDDAQTPQKLQLDLIDHQLEGEMNLDILRDIALELCALFTPQENGPHELIVKIQNYITENYHDPSLCLTKISDEFNISENYFSFLFKKEVNENFSDYLERLRMAKAKELVLHSDTMLSDLYQYLGYNNAASFRRVFKKTFGISPKEMREQNHA